MVQNKKSAVRKVDDSSQIYRMPDGLLPDPIADFIKLSAAEGDLLFWQWEPNLGRVDFYTPEKAAEKQNLRRLGENISNLIASRVDSFTLRSEKYEIKICDPQGNATWKKISLRFFLGADGEIERVVGTAQDITDLIAMQLGLENQLDFINTLLDSLSSPVFFKDAELVYRHCNKAFEEYLGKPKKDILAKTVFDLCPPHLAEIYHRADRDLLEQRLPQVYQTKVHSADGMEHNVIFNKSMVFNKKGEITGMIGIINDIDDRVQMENRLQRIMDIKDAIMEINRAITDANTSEQFYAIVLDCILSAMQSAETCGFLMLDSVGNLKMVAASGLYNAWKKPVQVELEKSMAWNAMAENKKSCFYIDDIHKFSRQKSIESHALLQQLKIRSLLGAPILNEGKLIGFITVGSRNIDAYDETDLFIMEYVRSQIIQVLNRQFLYDKNVTLARYDSLTGLLNRRYFEELFERHQNRAKRYDEKFHLVVIDLDNFKEINDQCGHLCGDAVLVDFAKKLTALFRESDIICRFGGDEFLLVLIDINISKLVQKIELIKTKLQTIPFIYNENSLPYSFSYGIAEWPADGANLDLLTCRADNEMYKNKRASKKQPNKMHHASQKTESAAFI
ncbi:diguanylate cyclase with PAS/PAC sensor [Psychromonas ingrahamii 37]|uniref:Diguanylate cyclase with PAS/PAC sensor n=1 Tax=Psychromonas ingrahamii (strain DSM 17664 / CCUG 51855 / 37) TaxID=357804 RepID=A1SU68_PSYIN|nr:diguanylate cyclase [Psychromonas ingrahamii]ABM03033.1 diguanylate cyclase with PAS/PAC sensor [Psychromonas ingrahamii 37]